MDTRGSETSEGGDRARIDSKSKGKRPAPSHPEEKRGRDVKSRQVDSSARRKKQEELDLARATAREKQQMLREAKKKEIQRRESLAVKKRLTKDDVLAECRTKRGEDLSIYQSDEEEDDEDNEEDDDNPEQDGRGEEEDDVDEEDEGASGESEGEDEGDKSTPSPARATKMDILHAITKQTDFSLKLAEQFMLTEENKNRNFVFSPLLVYIGLSMTTFGSGGPTRDQLLGFLGSKSINEIELLLSQLFTPMLGDREALGGPRLSLANGVWVDRSLTMKPAFKGFVVESCKATLKSVDFQSEADEVAKRVNAWAEEKTNGLIKQVLPPGSANNLTRLILANALYFKGTWDNYFHKQLTRYREFFLSNGSSVSAAFMTAPGPQYCRAFDGFKVLRLPYKNGRDNEHRFSMYLFLPEARDGLPSLVDKLGSVSGFIQCHAPYELVVLGEFFIPKFKISSGFEASEVLKEHGLALPFSPGGLTEMVGELGAGKELFVTGVFQKSCIEVDEHGTEAASAFASMTGGGCGPYEPMNFVADHPFMFVVREDVSGVVLFAGQLLNPLST